MDLPPKSNPDTSQFPHSESNTKSYSSYQVLLKNFPLLHTINLNIPCTTFYESLKCYHFNNKSERKKENEICFTQTNFKRSISLAVSFSFEFGYYSIAFCTSIIVLSCCELLFEMICQVDFSILP